MLSLAIRFGTLYDGLGGRRERGIAVIEDGRVVTIAGPEEPIPAGAAVREVACLVPGLINAHVHLEVRGEPDLMRVFIETTPTQRALV
ncbi:MAG: hypothetical protein ACREM2_11715, partial [Vulcanimicrobiaceae bacterium]